MPELITRRAWLLDAIRATGEPVSTHDAELLMAHSPWPTAGRNTLRKDLRGLARRQLLTPGSRHGRTIYTLKDHA